MRRRRRLAVSCVLLAALAAGCGPSDAPSQGGRAEDRAPWYPRPNAGSVIRATPPLPRIPRAPVRDTAAVLDPTGRDPDATREDVLAACHTLAPFAIPHVVTPSLEEALDHPLVLVAGVLVTGSLAPDERDRLIGYVREGGVLILARPADPTLLEALGLEATELRRGGEPARVLTFEFSPADPAVAYLDHPAERSWRIDLPPQGATRGYTPREGAILARWQDTGRGAVVRVTLGRGAVYVLGWRLRHMLARAERQERSGPEPPWTNTPVLGADAVRLLVRGVYEAVAGTPRLRPFAPDGKRAALILTHDVDARTGYERIPEFARFEHSRGVRATYLVTTMPYASGWTGALYTPGARDRLAEALRLGHEVGSHAFGHFPDFHQAPLGTGAESAGNYAPAYDPSTGTSGASVVGETGVSRWLLEQDLAGVRVVGFRSGYLRFPSPALYQGLARTGYPRDSSHALGLSQGAFPFAAHGRGPDGITLFPVVEYPVSISDRGLSADTVDRVVARWLDVIRANHANNAPTMLLIHTSDRPGKLEALTKLLDAIDREGLDLWIGPWGAFARFWEAAGMACEAWE